ncbi:hypothetical protein FA13DRAFT_1800481 [Coprinellus micaceus]|uniref:Uncharacterized protein n=1 Tax=Coprinellus micaceus TaxID=71717 RepID=A0A4Y7SH70_COPMI|nr:hypothetical protein FA13DRAFT_1800481 [Coprinellus micaceus]
MPYPQIEFTPEQLDANHELLLHAKGDETFPKDHTFLSGMVVEFGQYFQTSNLPSQPQTPEGGHRDTFIRADCHYADGDPVQWPQPLGHDHFYLAAIPLYCPGRSDPLYDILFSRYPPDSSYLISSTSHFTRLIPAHVSALKKVHSHLEDRIGEYLQHPDYRDDPYSKKYIINNRRSYANAFLARIESQPMTVPEMRRCVAEFQRFTLDVIAALDWDTIYHRRIEGQDPPATKIDDRMGLFTQDPSMVMSCVKAGLPFYYIQNYKNLAHTRIDTLAFVDDPWDTLNFDEGRIKSPCIFKGKVNDPGRLVQIYYNSRHILHSANIFACNYNPPPPRSNPPRSLNNAERNADTHRGIQVTYHPYRSNTISTAQRSNLSASLIIQPVISPLLPRVLDPWMQAINTIDRTQFPTTLPTDRGFAFPFISLFFQTATQMVNKSMVFRWAQLRDTMIFRVGPGAPPLLACPIPNRVWRRALQLDPTTFGSIRMDNSSSRAALEKREGVAFLDSSCQAFNAQVETLLQQPAAWRGNLYSTSADLDEVVVKEILWEVNELNFRHELLALDRRFYIIPDPEKPEHRNLPTSPKALDRHDHILDCVVPPPLARAFHVVEYPQASRGLANPDVRQRVPQLNHLSRLMRGWSASFTAFDMLDPADDPATLVQREAELYKFYVHQFFIIFGRAPVVPRSL